MAHDILHEKLQASSGQQLVRANYSHNLLTVSMAGDLGLDLLFPAPGTIFRQLASCVGAANTKGALRLSPSPATQERGYQQGKQNCEGLMWLEWVSSARLQGGLFARPGEFGRESTGAYYSSGLRWISAWARVKGAVGWAMLATAFWRGNKKLVE